MSKWLRCAKLPAGIKPCQGRSRFSFPSSLVQTKVRDGRDRDVLKGKRMSKLRDHALWGGTVGTALVRTSFFNQPTVLWVTPSCREEQQVEEDAAICPWHSRCLENVPRSHAMLWSLFYQECGKRMPCVARDQ